MVENIPVWRGPLTFLPWSLMYRNSLIILLLVACPLVAGGRPDVDPDVIEVKGRNFSLPILVGAREKGLVKEVWVYVSRGRGKEWAKLAALPPEKSSIPFIAPEDGLYWFATRLIHKDGKADPADLADLVPKIKVRVAGSDKEVKPAADAAEMQALRDRILQLERRVADLERRLLSGDRDPLVGTWAVVRFLADGTELSKKEAAAILLEFHDGRLTLSGPGVGKGEFSYKLNPGAGPGAIDLTALDGFFKGVTVPGLFEVDGADLRLVMPNQKTEKRPTRFDAPMGSGLGLFQARRVEKGK